MPFEYKFLGSLAYLGSNEAAYDGQRLKIAGFSTWFMWRGAYLSMQQTFKSFVRCLLMIFVLID